MGRHSLPGCQREVGWNVVCGTKGEGQVVCKVQASWHCLGRKRDHSIRRIARDLETAYPAIRDWLLRMRYRGLKGRFNARSKGRRAGLPLQIIRTVRRRLKRSPKKCGFETGSWQMDMATGMIRKEFGVTVRARTLRRWLRRIGFSWRKDRYVPYRSVSKERQEEFKREVGGRASQRRADGMAVFAEDEAAVQRSQNPVYGWRPTGGREQVRASFSRESVRIFGAMSQGGLLIKIVESTNSETFREFLEEIRRDRPRLFMVLNNASYHKSKAVREYVEPAWGRATTSPAARGADPLGTLGLRTPRCCDTKSIAALLFRVSLAGCHWSLAVLCESSDVSSFFSSLFTTSCSRFITP